MSEEILILDFGSQYTQVIARRIRECEVFGSILPYTATAEEIRERNPSGIIFSGGPASVYAKNAPLPDPKILELGVPILGICYGLQLSELSNNEMATPSLPALAVLPILCT